MFDMRSEALQIKTELEVIIENKIRELTKGCIRRKRMTVISVPNGSTIGVTEPFGTTINVPYVSTLSSVSVGDSVWVDYAYGMTNAVATMRVGGG